MSGSAGGGPDNPVILEAVELTRRDRKGRVGLDAVRFEVRAGEIYCLVGANGSGKTTTLELFAGLLTPTAGRALVCGLDALRYSLETGSRVAFFSREIRLYRELTAVENWRFFARLGGRHELDREAAHQALREVRLPERCFDLRVGTLNRGLRMKLGLAIATCGGGPAILLDEVLSGIGPADAADLVEILYEHRDRGRAILLATHDVFRARQIADRLGILNEGRKVLERRRAEIPSEDLELLYQSFLQESPRKLAGEW